MIRLLDKKVADKIAAGEVIDRPVSIVKELVENAVDAGSDSITVEIRKGGKEYIRVSDNGCGIDDSQLELAFKRHATSKISDISDLDTIVTLGFRGEALASIAAVSRTQLISKTESQKSGSQISVEGGEFIEKGPIGCEKGTTVIVKDLFYNVPARYKFLKQDQAEASLIIDFVSEMALCYDNIRFRLINNGQVLFLTQGKGSLYNNILTIYSKDIGNSLVPVDYNSDGIAVSGYVSKVSETRNSRRNQIFFVNGRNIKSKVIEKGLKEAYRERLFQGRFPIAFIFIKVSPASLDVNIHPNKKEIRFDNEKLVENAVTAAVKEALSHKEAVPELSSYLKEFRKAPETSFIKEKVNSNIIASHKSSPEIVIEKETVREEKEAQINVTELLSTMREEKRQEEIQPIIRQPVSRPFDFSELTVRASVFATYIICEDYDSMYLIDQHAAHERIFYEKLLKQFNDSEKYSQKLLLPLIINIPVTACSTEWEETLRGFAFGFESFGVRTYRFDEIPDFMSLDEAEGFINDFFSAIDENTDIKSASFLDKTATRACKSAVKGNQLLDDKEAKALIDALSLCENPYSCPHGRPVFIKFTRSQIERMFKRV